MGTYIHCPEFLNDPKKNIAVLRSWFPKVSLHHNIQHRTQTNARRPFVQSSLSPDERLHFQLQLAYSSDTLSNAWHRESQYASVTTAIRLSSRDLKR